MALRERGYKAAAVRVLEIKIGQLEEKDKTAQTKPIDEKDFESVNSNINFAEELFLINATQADIYRKRILKAQNDFRNFERTESLHITDDFENPRERAKRFYKLDEYRNFIDNNKSNSINDGDNMTTREENRKENKD